MAESEPPKIIVDSDWKSQARAEKDRLEAAEKAAAAKKPAPRPDAAGAAPEGEERMPPADFQTLLGTMVTQAILYLGGIPDPQTGRAVVSLDHARFHIDLLAVLEEKTRGNLTAEEAQDLTQTLHELRVRYVEISRAVAAAMAKQAKAGVNPGGPMGPLGRGPGPGGIGPGGPAGPGLRVS